jgi:formate dehydrogenase iron-sulfur subunit
MHCLEPSCVSACLVGGLTLTEEGAVIYDPNKCIGCRYCMLACPFHIPRYEWSETVPFVKKCTLCFTRLKEGEIPACVEACPNQALQFGKREELLELAHNRTESEPSKYLPHIWGEHEFGGTSVLYLSDVDLDALGWPRQGEVPIPEITEPLISKTPHIGISVLASLCGLNWIIKRRTLLMGSTGEEER